MRKFTDEHEWLDCTGEVATVGITTHAAEQLGDLVFIELPKVGAKLTKGEAAAVVESVKAASDVYTPASGIVIEGNAALTDNPALVNEDPEGDGWFFKLTLRDDSELGELMDEEKYAAYIARL